MLMQSQMGLKEKASIFIQETNLSFFCHRANLEPRNSFPWPCISTVVFLQAILLFFFSNKNPNFKFQSCGWY